MSLVDLPPFAAEHPETGLLLAGLDVGTREWRGELGALSTEALVWQPFPGAHSIGAILLHIADVEGFWLTEVAAGTVRPPEEIARLLSRETEQYAGLWPTPPAEPLAWYYAQMDAVRARTVMLLKKREDTHSTGESRGDRFTLRWLLAHVLTHEAYHGGQAVLLASLYARSRA